MTERTDRYPGVAIAIVTDIDDPAGEGRVRLSFPWLDDRLRSPWVPIAAPLAGQQRGFFFSPEVDDEVLVAFEHGDFEHPFVLGYLWNGVDLPPESDRANRVIVTPGGHTLRFEDGDPKKVILRSSLGHELMLDDTNGTGKISIQSAAGQSIVIDDAGQKIEIKGGGRTISMQGGQLQIA